MTFRSIRLKIIPYRPQPMVFDLKVVLLLAIFVYAFFRFTWSLRQYTFGALLVAAAPAHDRFESEAARHAFADRAGRVMGLAKVRLGGQADMALVSGAVKKALAR